MPESIFGGTSVPPMVLQPAAKSEVAASEAESKNLIDQLRERFSTSRTNLEAARADFEKQQRKLSATKAELARLTAELDRCRGELANAERVLTSFKAQLAEREAQMPTFWADEAGCRVAPLGGPNYSAILNLHAAIEDFPRVQKVLAAKVAAAERALKEFAKKNASS